MDDNALMKVLSQLAHSPLTVAELEDLESKCIATLMYPELGTSADSARLLLRMMSEIRKARGIFDADPSSEPN